MSHPKLHHRFGSESHEYFDLPVGQKTLDISIQQPGEMTPETGLAVASAIAEHHEALTDFFDASGYEDQSHVQPEVRIALPGTYLKHFGDGEKHGNTVIGRLSPTNVEHTTLTVNFGSLHMSIVLKTGDNACEAISDAIGGLIDELLGTFPVCRSEEVLADIFS